MITSSVATSIQATSPLLGTGAAAGAASAAEAASAGAAAAAIDAAAAGAEAAVSCANDALEKPRAAQPRARMAMSFFMIAFRVCRRRAAPCGARSGAVIRYADRQRMKGPP